MISSTEPARRALSQQRLLIIWALVFLPWGGLATLGVAGLRINLTPSEPLGIWRIARLDRPARRGDLVFICPPINEIVFEGLKRRYLRRGLCAGDLAPLIKSIVATARQRVEVDEEIRIDGEVLSHARLMVSDSQGRPLEPHPGGLVPAGHVFLHSTVPGSFDSRYFGPVPVQNILGLAQELWTYAP